LHKWKEEIRRYSSHYGDRQMEWNAHSIAPVLTLKDEVHFILTAKMNELFQAGSFEDRDDARPWIVEVNWLFPFVKIFYQCSYTLLQ
jgi:hypothetical protein